MKERQDNHVRSSSVSIGAPSVANPSLSPLNTRLLILGDSITLGVCEVRGNDVVGRVRTPYVDRLRTAFPIVDIEIDADVHRTTTAAIKTVATTLASVRPDVVLVMLGGNDADLDWKRFVLSDGAVVRHRVNVETYEKNLRHIVAAIRTAGATPVLTDLPNHHFELRGPYVSKIAGRDVTGMLERGGGQAASDGHLARYRGVVDRVAAELHLPVVRYGLVLDQHPPREMTAVDGVHPSDAAHAVIADAIIAVLTMVLTPSPGTPGEGRGERAFGDRTAFAIRNHPHPGPLPEYRERGPSASKSA
jgi:lysophospholipase L1-like esterase